MRLARCQRVSVGAAAHAGPPLGERERASEGGARGGGAERHRRGAARRARRALSSRSACMGDLQRQEQPDRALGGGCREGAGGAHGGWRDARERFGIFHSTLQVEIGATRCEPEEDEHFSCTISSRHQDAGSAHAHPPEEAAPHNNHDEHRHPAEHQH